MKLRVAAGIIMKNGKVLIAQRKEDCAHEPLKWEFPGGKIEKGETPQECLRREIAEELGLEIEVEERFCESSSEGLILIVFIAKPVKGEPKAIDVKDWRWARIEELGRYDWAQADLPVVEKLKNMGRD